MDGERRAGRGEGGERLAFRHARGAAGDAGQHHALRHFRHGQLAAERGGGGGEGRHARRQRVGDAAPLEPAQLLGERAADREVAGMQPRHVLAGRVRRHELGLDLVERHRRGVDDARARRAMRQQLRRHDRAGIEADRAARDQVASAQGDEVGGARPGADEMHGHGVASSLASAQVTGPTTMRGENEPRLRPAGGERRGLGDRRHAGQREHAPRPCRRRAPRRFRARPASTTDESAAPRAAAAAAMPASSRLRAAVARQLDARQRPAGALERRVDRRADLRRPTRPCGSRCRRRSWLHPQPIA